MNLQEAVADLDLHPFISKVPHIPVMDLRNWDRDGSRWRSMYTVLSSGNWLKVNRLLKHVETSYFGHMDLCGNSSRAQEFWKKMAPVATKLATGAIFVVASIATESRVWRACTGGSN
ncbi:hypothetical protein AXG93_2817s1080 [Marchantia polymorpha subsp. ruderalis]|uniref:Uncharacterized protein n=1 Tax=Marchantia polymorpha subsp. ruderalis TaxID=1480154 RepID=A0A176W3T8_MARPO|nr:hypothetical protein AXG93_2817s1080 [Marchantia polymorpha subsp. ruderalis]